MKHFKGELLLSFFDLITQETQARRETIENKKLSQDEKNKIFEEIKEEKDFCMFIYEKNHSFLPPTSKEAQEKLSEEIKEYMEKKIIDSELIQDEIKSDKITDENKEKKKKNH